MRYELYECRDENMFMFLCEDDDFSQITQPFSKPNNENRQQYILLDNEGGNLILYPSYRPIPPQEQKEYVFACKRCKFLCVNSRDIVLDWDTWLFRAFDEASAFAERETAAVMQRRRKRNR